MSKLRLLFRLGLIASSSRSTRIFYDRISPFYEVLFTDHLPHIEKMAETVTELFPDNHDLRILDLACGTGSLSRLLAKSGHCVIGLDFSLKSLARLRQSTEGISVMQGNAAALPFNSTSFDVVTCMGAWRHFPGPKEVLSEIVRVLKPDGAFLVGYFPPKLGGLLSVPSGKIGKLLAFLYFNLMRVLHYADRADPELGNEIRQMLESSFINCRVIPSKGTDYLLCATSPTTH